jgi:xanthine dehydrogenase large subunit
MKPVAHESASVHVTGAALYTDDVMGRFPRLLHAWPVLAPIVHGTVVSLDPARALEEPGVCTILTAQDAPGEPNTAGPRRDEPLFPSEIQYHRQPLMWVLGESLEAARRGAEKVSVVCEPLPAILTIEQAIAAGSFLAAPQVMRRGDAASALAASPHRLQGEIALGGQEHFYLETQSALAWLDDSAGISVYSSTQHPSEAQEIVARVLGLLRNQVTVECLRMGGAFGGKESQANVWAALAALGAWKTRRPVRVRLPRALDLALTGKRHPFLARFQAGFDSHGRILGLQVVLYSDAGWSADLSEPVMARALFHIDNCYFLPAVEAAGFVCRTHKTSQTAFRGFGGPQGMLVIEDILDRIARTLSLPPEQVRERNFYRETQTTHYGQQVKDACRIAQIWRQLKQSSALDARRAAIDRFNDASPHTKRGLAITPVKFGISFTATWYNQAGALVLVYRDGSVQVNHGGTEMGQGLYTKIRQIAAQSLGVPPESIRLMPASTGKVPNTSASAASASTDLNGAAVAAACAEILERLRPVAAELLACAPHQVKFRNGTASSPSKTISFATLTEAAYRSRVSLFAHGSYRTPDIHYDAKTAHGQPFHYFAYGAAVSEVELDGFTGQYRLLRVDILQDVGDSIAPLIDLGQIEGGFLQGVGWLTLEELLWDERGRIATGGASTYKLPSWSEMPEVFHVDFLQRATEPGVIMGSKAVGEPPLMLALSVREALRDAIARFGGGGIVALDSPLTPERVFWALDRARKEAPELAATATGAVRP